MQNLHIDYRSPDHGFEAASHLAKDVAKQNRMGDPTIISWHRSSRVGPTAPFYEGANPDTWWKKYGEGNGGKLEISVGDDDYQFIMMDTNAYETVGDLPLRNLTDSQGNEYLCYTPLQGRESSIPKANACTLLDDWVADQY